MAHKAYIFFRTLFFGFIISLFILPSFFAQAQDADTSIVPSRSPGRDIQINTIEPTAIPVSGSSSRGPAENPVLDGASSHQSPTVTGGTRNGRGGGGSCVGDYSTVGKIFTSLMCIISVSIIPILVSLGLLIFIWGVVQVIGSAGNEEKREQGKQFMLWGIIGLFVIVSVWGIIGILTNTFGFGAPVIPQLP